MTALTALSAPPPSTAKGGAPAAKETGDGESNAFARALHRRQAADDGPGTSRPSSSADDAAMPREPDAVDGPERSGTPGTEPVAASVVDGQQAAPVWPPHGLAGLLGFADGTTSPRQAGEDGALATPLGDALAGAPGPSAARAALAAPDASAPALALALAEAPLPDDVALALTDPAPEPSALAEGGEPAPVAFALPAPAALREPPPLLAAPLPTPEVGAEDFEARFGAQLQWMADRKIGEARIRVTPNDLGPVEVRLHLDGDRLRADFVSANAETRNALEQGLPRLRDLLGEHGFQLTHVDVGSGRGGGNQAEGTASQERAASATDETAGITSGLPPRARVLGLLDAYA